MSRLLWKYMLWEVLRPFILTCVVLSSVIAIGAAIKPLAHGHVGSALQMLKYVVLATVPMLQFSLPFAAGFAATTGLHRLAADNEILAMSAAGLSYRRILAPFGFLGLILVGLMFLLTQWVIPRFWGVMENTIATDVTRVFQGCIARGVPFEHDKVQIYADELIAIDSPADSDADMKLALLHVAAAELDDTGRIVTDVTAKHAVIDIHRREGRTILKLVLDDAVVYKAQSGELVRTPEFRPTHPIVLPNILEDDLITMDRGELRELREYPDDFSFIRQARQALCDDLSNLIAQNELDRVLAESGQVRLHDVAANGRSYLIHADTLQGQRLTRADGAPIEVIQFDGQSAVRRMTARAAAIERGSAGTLTDITFDLVLHDYEVTDLATGGTNQRQEQVFANVLVPTSVTSESLMTLSSAELIARTQELDPDGTLDQRIRRLRVNTGHVKSEITSRLWKRAALSWTAALLLLLGAVLAIHHRHSLPLQVYLWAFLPSLVDLFLISGGEQSLRQGKDIGLLILWSGNIGVLVLLIHAFRKLGRH